MKKLAAAFAMLCLIIALTPLVARADTPVSASGRVGFYYQYENATKNTPNTYDLLLAPRIEALTGGRYAEIYHDSSTDRYITGRGCDLLSHGHAYQYLLGKADTAEERADVLFEFLKISPVWSNYGSSLSRPNAEYIYSNYLASLPGVSRYSGGLNNADSVAAFQLQARAPRDAPSRSGAVRCACAYRAAWLQGTHAACRLFCR